MLFQQLLIMKRSLGEHSSCNWTVQHWFQKFRCGDTNLEGQGGRRRPFKIDYQNLKNLFNKTHIKVIEISQAMNVRISAQNMSRKLARWRNSMGSTWTQSKSKMFQSVFDAFSVELKQSISGLNSDLWQKMYPLWQSKIIGWFYHDKGPKHFPKPKLHKQNIIVTVWWFAVGVVH